MKCEEIREFILDGNSCERSASAEEAMRSHLEKCETCRQLHEQTQRSWLMMEELPEVEPSPAFNRFVWQKIEGQTKTSWMRIFSLALISPPVRTVAWAVVVIFSAYLVIHISRPPVTPPKAGPPEKVVQNDEQDNQMLMELDALLKTDESQFLSQYQNWKGNIETARSEGDEMGKPGPKQKNNPTGPIGQSSIFNGENGFRGEA